MFFYHLSQGSAAAARTRAGGDPRHRARLVSAIERALGSFTRHERINYLMLMMVDPHVHFHIFPRYRGARSIAGLELADHGWPGPPDLKSAVELDSAAIGRAVVSFA